MNNEISFNPNYFLTSWADTVGYINIKFFYRKKFQILKKYKIIFREFFSTKREDLKIHYNDENNYENLILTYFFPKNLKKDGSYFDRYFSLNTKFDKKTIWVLIPINENKSNNKINNNILIIKRIFKNYYKNFLLSFFYFFKNFLKVFFSEI